eukprot:3369720-Rhodomonas_salina.2
MRRKAGGESVEEQTEVEFLTKKQGSAAQLCGVYESECERLIHANRWLKMKRRRATEWTENLGFVCDSGRAEHLLYRTPPGVSIHSESSAL